ncbi:MAG: diguanylate cyclase [Candidatus Loosdrechtia sp.]|uniref:diguanylate cyclase n=1 Tax=Candidatus Loosdrechtia sp. TaxID=3101272 RepID=UPI003A644E18|nr:MAG: diguanylate cyclase [Candidatus Jettenia sp. AMX2]
MNFPGIIVISNDPPIDTLLVDLLRKEGYRVLDVRDGQTALKILSQSPVAVAVISEKLCDMDGIVFVRKLASQFPDVRVIIVNSYPGIEQTREALLAGVYDYITWPITDSVSVVSLVQRAMNEFIMIQRNRDLLQKVQSEVTNDDVASLPIITDRWTKELLALRAISMELSAIMEVPRILRVISNNISLLFEYTLMAVLVEIENKWNLFLFSGKSFTQAFIDACIENLLTLHSLFVGRPCTRRDIQVCQIDDIASSPGTGTFLRADSELRSHITFPLVAGGETLGSISLCSHAKKAFTAVDVQVFSLISYQLASTLCNARLFQYTQKMTVTDHLTSLYNRRYFDEILDHEYSRAHRYKRPLSLALIDIDNFKQVNDTFGHPSGDFVLQQLANLLRKSTREVDIVVRHGGEEFALLLPDTSLEKAAILIERLRLEIQNYSFVTARHKILLTVSAGVATLGENGTDTKEELISHADESLLVAKKCGRNRVRLYFPSKDRTDVKNRKIEENRRFLQRVPLHLPVRYIQVHEDNIEAKTGISYNISMEGISFEAKEKLPQGSYVILDLTLPLKDSEERVRILGNVVWSNVQKGGENVTVGARILSLSSASRRRIEKLVVDGSADSAKKSDT